jgi:hypothetical protein
MRVGLLDRVRRLARFRVPRRWSRSAGTGPAGPSAGAQGTRRLMGHLGQQGRLPQTGSMGYAGSSAGLTGRHRRDAGLEVAHGERSGAPAIDASGPGPGEAGYRSAALSGHGPGGHGPGGPGPGGSGSDNPGPGGHSPGGHSPGGLFPSGPVPSGPAAGSGASFGPTRSGAGRPRQGASAVRVGSGQARVREAPQDEQGIPLPRAVAGTSRAASSSAASSSAAASRAAASRAASRAAGASATAARAAPPVPKRPVWRAAHASLRARLPFTAPHARDRPVTADGRRNCGSIEGLIWRQWDTGIAPPAEVVAAIDRLAELPERIKTRLADGLDAIFIGPGGVPELDDMTALRGVALPSGRASWDACAGAYGDRKIVVGTQPSPTPDVMCHEIGHALDDIDSPSGKWQSDSAEFRMLYDQCQPLFASDFHRQPGGLGRKEFFADAFAAIASAQRPALVDMLGGETRTALRVMLYFNRRYDI